MKNLDLHITLRYIDANDIPHMPSHLFRDPEAARCAGWYLRVYQDGGRGASILPYTLLSAPGVQHIARVMDLYLRPGDLKIEREVKSHNERTDKARAEQAARLRKQIEHDQAMLAALEAS